MNNQPKENTKKSHLNQLLSVQTQNNTGDPVEPSVAKVRSDDGEDESYNDDIDTTSTSEIEEEKKDDDDKENMMDVNDTD